MLNKVEEIVKDIFKKAVVFLNEGIDKANLLVRNIIAEIKKLNIKEKFEKTVYAVKSYDIKNIKNDINILWNKLKEESINIVGSDKSMDFVSKMSVARINICSVCVLAFFVVAAGLASNLNFGYSIVCEGKTVAITKDRATAVEAYGEAEKELSTIATAKKPDVEIIFTVANEEMFHNLQYASNAVVAAFDGKESAYGIFADGKLVVPVESEDVANELLTAYKNEYVKEGVLEVGFNKNVEILRTRVEAGSVKSNDEAAKILRQPAGGFKVHVVADGETISEIAENAGTTTANLMKLNPGVTPETLQIGAKLSVSDNTPVIAVLTKEQTRETEKIAYETNKVEDKNTYKGITIVVSDGQYGEKEVDYDVYKENGVVTKKVATAESITKEPVTKQVKVGSKARPATASTGSFMNPFAAGMVTSRYGQRTRNFHQGIDLAGSVGSPVYAADGGVVTFTGWNSGYGKLIKIRHDNGYETYYAHLSSINVSQGSRVAKGALIGKVGNTGVSTGPHLHFEIRINGKAVNPGSYIGR